MAYEIPTDIWLMLDDAINNGYEDVLAADLVCNFGLPEEAIQAIRNEFGIQ